MTWSVQCICCVRRSSLVALVWLSRKFSLSCQDPAALPRRAFPRQRPTEQSTLIDRLIAARVASSSSTTGGAGGTCDPSSSTSSLGEHFLGGDLAMAPGCHCQQLLTRAGFAHSHGAPARRAPSYGTGLPVADTGRLCPLARRPGKTGA